MLGFLPLEKIPILVWGLILVWIAGFLATQEEFLTRAQVIDVGMVVVGAAAFIFDVIKRTRRPRNEG